MDLIRTRNFEFQLVLLNFQLVLLTFQLVTRNSCFTISRLGSFIRKVYQIFFLFLWSIDFVIIWRDVSVWKISYDDTCYLLNRSIWGLPKIKRWKRWSCRKFKLIFSTESIDTAANVSQPLVVPNQYFYMMNYLLRKNESGACLHETRKCEAKLVWFLFSCSAKVSVRIVRRNTIAGSNQFDNSVLLIGPTSLRGSWWPSGRLLNKTHWLTSS